MSGNGSMIDSAVTPLPQPDSPTMQTVLPALVFRVNPSTARSVPRGVRNEVKSPGTLRDVILSKVLSILSILRSIQIPWSRGNSRFPARPTTPCNR